ncbi:ATP-binding protein [Vibrio sp. YIC-376]|uniref:ATP-binding protein n=1 Tax=Vibrio sp. YIC-376 TaxID=3136162 RepID=UPI00402A8F2F
MKLKNYLALSTILTTSSIVVTVTIAILFLLKGTYQEGIEERGRELARVIAHDPTVISAVEKHNRNSQGDLQEYIEDLRTRTDTSYIVILDKNALRLSHPTQEKVGQKFIGEDVETVLSTGDEYSSVAIGSLGKAIRNFAPIFLNGEVIGAVCIGYLYETAFDLIIKRENQIGLLIGLVYLLGIGTTVTVVYKIKRTFLELEPEFIVNKFKENELMLDSIRDSIIAVDNDMNITFINESAIDKLSMGVLGRYDYMNHPISCYSKPLSHLILSHLGKYSQGEFDIGKFSYKANIYPIKTGRGLNGHVIVFFANLEHNELEKELTYLKNYSQLLRSKTHEYSNKLNVLSGMLQIGNYKEAINFIQLETDNYQSIVRNIVMTINDSAIAGLILAKFNKASDMGVKFTVDADTTLSCYEKDISNKLITIIGNLIDNALLAAWQNKSVVKPEVQIYLSDRSNHIIIEVEDSGSGVPDKLNEYIFDLGVSSKSGDEQSGIGLYLVKQIIDYFQGSIDWERSENNTTVFSVYLNKKEVLGHE